MTTHATIPPESLYWAVLDPGVLPPASGPKRREQLGFLFERFLPRPVEQIQAAYVVIAKDAVLACGIDRDRLDGVDALTLTPESIPTCIAEQLDEPVAPEQLNLLTGDFEPIRVRAMRKRWLMQLAAAAVIAMGFLVVGVERRVQAARATGQDVSIAISDAHMKAVGPSADGGPQFSKLTSELRRLRQTRRADTDLMPTDPTPDLAAWLANWPLHPPAQTQTLVASGTAMSITTNLQDNDDAQAIIDALSPPDGWKLTQPSLNSASDGVRLTLRVEPGDGP